MNKNGFDMAFSWIFAIIVGVVILLLAIYGVTKLIGSEKYQSYTEISKKITIVLDSMETGGEELKKAPLIDFGRDATIYSDCSNSGISAFGKNTIRFSEKSEEAGSEIEIYDKYIFSDNMEDGRVFYLFAKPFFMPFKVGDVMVLSSKSYCFKNPPESIRDDLEIMGIENIKIDDCSGGDIEVCFEGSCDVEVRGTCDYSCEDKYDKGYVKKDDETLYYSGSLIYGAIFASPENYECNVRRLMVRLSQLSRVYLDKLSVVRKVGCVSNIEAELLLLSSEAEKLLESEKIGRVETLAKAVDDKNKEALCKVY